jgi:hypothetical protein
MRNVIAFTDAAQIYEARIPFNASDYSGFTVSANVKLAAGGCEVGPVLAELYAVSGTDPYPLVTGAAIDIYDDDLWKGVTLTITDSTPFETTDSIGLRVHTQACNQ